MKILQFPLARITVWFVLGIICAYWAKPDLALAALALILSFFAFSICWFVAQKHFRQQLFFGWMLYVLSFFVGMATQMIHTDYLRSGNYIHFVKERKDQSVQITIREKLKSNAFSDRYIAIVNCLDEKKTTGKILINLGKTKKNIPFCMGSNLLVKGKIIRHKSPLNPNQFDYGKYLTDKSIPAQMYVGFNNVKISSHIEKDIWYCSDVFRNKIISNLSRSGFHAEELHVVNALILGQQQEISPDVLHDYQFAGAVHILSVSGLHVGFILLFLDFLLKPLPKNRLGRVVKLIIIISFLWGFAIIAGLSPSVVRSATMFSFVAWGMYLKRSTNIFHTLLVSLLLILLFEPAFLFDVGFQLSYTALFFILWLQPLLSGIWTPKNRIMKYFWEILTVSFAAQLGAFPLSIYYFHQFPGLFFITNLVIIPFLSIIMVLGVLVMLMAAFGFVPLFPAKILEWCIFIMDKIIGRIASFEKFIIQDIPLNFYILASLYALIFAVVIWFEKPTFHRLALASIAAIIFQASFYWTQFNNWNQSELVVFNVKKKTIITEKLGEDVFVYSNGIEKTSKNPMLKSYVTANFSRIKNTYPLQNVLCFGNHKILVLDSTSVYPKNASPDILVFTKSPKINLERLLQVYKPKIIVADASNFKSYSARWKQTCLKEKIPFHNTGEKGFYRLEKTN
ncbi:MAG TPA: ComEC/Rec2 family competence protein [Flavobacterium sp.]|nr:ComEC/Rec2 family competence protein [Flavobacterium sp.]